MYSKKKKKTEYVNILMALLFSLNRKFANLLLHRKLPFMYELIAFFQFTFNNLPPKFKTIGFVSLNCLPLIPYPLPQIYVLL